MSSAPLKLYWSNRIANFGDWISRDIVAHVSGRRVEWAPRHECDMFAVGSILDHAAVGVTEQTNPTRKAVVWGGGLLEPYNINKLIGAFQSHLTWAAVRGPLTATLLDLKLATYGDPGLLIADIAPKGEPHDRIGLVLHHSQKLQPAFLKRMAKDGRFVLVDVMHEDHLEVVRRISACRAIVSSSLHGVIVADAYGVPNTWWMPTKIHNTPRLKFYDYALSIGRDLGEPFAGDLLRDFDEAALNEPARHAERIETLKQGLRAAFPKRLKKRPAAAAAAGERTRHA